MLFVSRGLFVLGRLFLSRISSAELFDHIKPWALGGETSEENLRLLCRNCNQRESIERFGSYLREPTVVYSA